jgi:protein-disulfide isomerase
MRMGFFAAAAVALLVASCGDGGLPIPGAQTVEIKSDDRVHGSPNAPVTIIEYASMTCPHCAAFNRDVIPQLTKEYIDTGKVKLVFRDFPLDAGARMASAVARCFSGEQYFSFIDLLFANQMGWIKDFDGNRMITREDIVEGLSQMAGRSGMAREKVAACASDEKNLAAVDANWMEGENRYNVRATPTFIINGTPHVGGMSFDDLKKIIDPLARK